MLLFQSHDKKTSNFTCIFVLISLHCQFSWCCLSLSWIDLAMAPTRASTVLGLDGRAFDLCLPKYALTLVVPAVTAFPSFPDSTACFLTAWAGWGASRLVGDLCWVVVVVGAALAVGTGCCWQSFWKSNLEGSLSRDRDTWILFLAGLPPGRDINSARFFPISVFRSSISLDTALPLLAGLLFCSDLSSAFAPGFPIFGSPRVWLSCLVLAAGSDLIWALPCPFPMTSFTCSSSSSSSSSSVTSSSNLTFLAGFLGVSCSDDTDTFSVLTDWILLPIFERGRSFVGSSTVLGRSHFRVCGFSWENNQGKL